MRKTLILSIIITAFSLCVWARGEQNYNPNYGNGVPSGSCISGSTYTDSATGNNWTCTGSVWQKASTSAVMSATTGSIGGGLLAVGACATGTVAVAGAVPGQPVAVSASDGTNMAALGAYIHGDVTSGGTVTVSVCAIISLTPASKTYNVRVIP